MHRGADPGRAANYQCTWQYITKQASVPETIGRPGHSSDISKAVGGDRSTGVAGSGGWGRRGRAVADGSRTASTGNACGARKRSDSTQAGCFRPRRERSARRLTGSRMGEVPRACRDHEAVHGPRAALHVHRSRTPGERGRSGPPGVDRARDRADAAALLDRRPGREASGDRRRPPTVPPQGGRAEGSQGVTGGGTQVWCHLEGELKA